MAPPHTLKAHPAIRIPNCPLAHIHSPPQQPWPWQVHVLAMYLTLYLTLILYLLNPFLTTLTLTLTRTHIHSPP